MDSIQNEAELNNIITTPSKELVDYMQILDGDIVILGVAGKMGVNLAVMAKRAIDLAGVQKRVLGVARFSDPEAQNILESAGVETRKCDLSNPDEVASLEKMKNVIYMVAKKFGTDGSEDITWVMNTLVPGYVVRHFKDSNIVDFSTGCVYPLVDALEGGCDETVKPAPIGDYATSAYGREMMFNYACRMWQTKVCHFRLNYSVDLRYGVLHDICQKIIKDEVVDLSTGHFNCLWQGDAVAQAILCLKLCSCPATPINITGPETLTMKDVAVKMAKLLGKQVQFVGSPGKTYLSNSMQATKEFGYPSKSVDELIQMQVKWLQNGGKSLGKPTKFEVTDGKF